MTDTIFDKIIFSAIDNDIVNDGYGNRQKYEVELNYNGKTYTAYYIDSVRAYRNGEEINFRNVMECLLMDKSAYDCYPDIDDFQNEFGYEKVSECLKAYNGCKETSEGLERLFTEEELEELKEEFEV